MKCPNCKNNNLSIWKTFWSSEKNPTNCSECEKLFYFVKKLSTWYWSIVLSGMPIFFFIGFFFGNAYAPIYFCASLILVGFIIQFLELKFSLYKEVSHDV